MLLRNPDFLTSALYYEIEVIHSQTIFVKEKQHHVSKGQFEKVYT